jgi:DNA-binding NarL/FixJ family response regulator
MKIKILLVDGRKMTREGLAVLLGSQPDIDVVGEANDIETAPRVAEAVSANIAVMLVGTFTQRIAERIKTLTRQVPGLRVIILLIHLDGAVLRQAFEAGAAGCLSKECAAVELVAAIRAVHTGETYLSPRASNEVVNRYLLGNPTAGTAPPLSVREREVVRRIANGETTKEIARHLSVGPKTVETHRRRAMEKIGVHTVAGLTRYALQHGMICLEHPLPM